MRIFGGIAKIAVPDGGVDDGGSVSDGVASDGAVSDAELLAAHIAGDRHAFSALLARHHDHLWQVARRTSYSNEDAADALQEALLSAHRRASGFREDAAVRSWLHSIVVNACLDRIRRNRVRVTVPLFEDDSHDLRTPRDPIHDTEIALDIESACSHCHPTSGQPSSRWMWKVSPSGRRRNVSVFRRERSRAAVPARGAGSQFFSTTFAPRGTDRDPPPSYSGEGCRTAEESRA